MSVPDTVALFSCPAYDEEGERTTISGLFDTVEHQPIEPAMYASSPYWIVVPHGQEDDSPSFSVDADVFDSQVRPKEYGRQLASDREWELAMEDEYAREGR